jgi:hypothetical protein
MTLTPSFTNRIRLLVNSAGLSCMGGAIFLQIIVFSNIAGQGYFKAIETNNVILSLEIILTAFTAVYFIYLYQKVIRSNIHNQS